MEHQAGAEFASLLQSRPGRSASTARAGASCDACAGACHNVADHRHGAVTGLMDISRSAIVPVGITAMTPCQRDASGASVQRLLLTPADRWTMGSGSDSELAGPSHILSQRSACWQALTTGPGSGARRLLPPWPSEHGADFDCRVTDHWRPVIITPVTRWQQRIRWSSSLYLDRISPVKVSPLPTIPGARTLS
jgi:hypothetical protein